jgi:alkylhydroperoxidase/carboxymuconolactone decarboxylase family protein YurZ
MLPKKQNKAFTDFYNSANTNDILDSKTTLMIHLAASMAVGCYPSMDHYLGVAREKGITEGEVGAVLSIVMAVSAGRVRAQLREVQSRDKKRQPAQSEKSFSTFREVIKVD